MKFYFATRLKYPPHGRGFGRCIYVQLRCWRLEMDIIRSKLRESVRRLKPVLHNLWFNSQGLDDYITPKEIIPDDNSLVLFPTLHHRRRRRRCPTRRRARTTKRELKGQRDFFCALHTVLFFFFYESGNSVASFSASTLYVVFKPHQCSS